MDITAKTIKQLRKSLSLSQEDFASLLGTTGKTIHRWETGKNKPSEWQKSCLGGCLLTPILKTTSGNAHKSGVDSPLHL